MKELYEGGVLEKGILPEKPESEAALAKVQTGQTPMLCKSRAYCPSYMRTRPADEQSFGN